jgi:predicted dehydrogenase
MQKVIRLFAVMTIFTISMFGQTTAKDPLRLAIVGLNHGHVAGFFQRNLHRPDIQIVGIAEPVASLRDKYAQRFGIDKSLFYASLTDMIAKTHPKAVLVYADTYDHRKIVEECAARGVHVMMEKPLAVSYADALAMQKAAKAGHIHVLVNYETTWYSSNKAAFDLVRQGALGNVWKVVAHDGHEGPKEIHVQPEFFAWLTNPKLNGAGALFDFGCYGADLMTVLMHGQAPTSVTAVTKQIKPDIYPHVDDEADVVLNYSQSVAILQPSWNWPFAIKDMIVYGKTGYAKTVLTDGIEVRRAGEKAAQSEKAKPLPAPYDDSIHYFRGVLDGQVPDEHALSSLDTNIVVSEILDAARRSAQTGKTVTLPLPD